MTKERILEDLRSARASWEALLAEVGEGRMEEPGVEGEWSVKNIVAHVTTADRWITERLWELVRGEEYTMTDFDLLDDDSRNAVTLERNRHRPLQEILAEAREVFPRLMGAVEALSEEDLTDPQRYEWAQGSPLWRYVAGNSYRHYAEHSEAIRAWLDGEPARE